MLPFIFVVLWLCLGTIPIFLIIKVDKEVPEPTIENLLYGFVCVLFGPLSLLLLLIGAWDDIKDINVKTFFQTKKDE